MKTTKTIEEYYCDFCGAECPSEHYDVVLPFAQPNKYTSRYIPEIQMMSQSNICVCATSVLKEMVYSILFFQMQVTIGLTWNKP